MSIPDNGPVIVGITWWLTFLCGAFLVLRIYAKVSRRQGLWWDDHILILSWFLLLAEAIITQMGQNIGFGKHSADIAVEHLPTIALYTSIGASISCFASTLSKISFGITLLRLVTGSPYLRIFLWWCVITLFVVMIPSALFTWIQCTPREKAWNFMVEGTCWDDRITIRYGIFNAAYCATVDFILALLPWKLIWGLRMRWREKVGVGIAMSMGVLAGVCAIVKGVYIIQLREQDFYYNGKDVTIWTAVETAVAIIGASIPVLRVFFKEAVSSFSASHGKPTHYNDSKNVHLSSLNRFASRRTRARASGIITGGKDGQWAELDDYGDDDCASQNDILRRDGNGNGIAGVGVGVGGAWGLPDEEIGTVISSSPPRNVKGMGILQTSTVTVEIEERRSSVDGKSSSASSSETEVEVEVRAEGRRLGSMDRKREA